MSIEICPYCGDKRIDKISCCGEVHFEVMSDAECLNATLDATFEDLYLIEQNLDEYDLTFEALIDLYRAEYAKRYRQMSEARKRRHEANRRK